MILLTTSFVLICHSLRFSIDSVQFQKWLQLFDNAPITPVMPCVVSSSIISNCTWKFLLTWNCILTFQLRIFHGSVLKHVLIIIFLINSIKCWFYNLHLLFIGYTFVTFSSLFLYNSFRVLLWLCWCIICNCCRLQQIVILLFLTIWSMQKIIYNFFYCDLIYNYYFDHKNTYYMTICTIILTR